MLTRTCVRQPALFFRSLVLMLTIGALVTACGGTETSRRSPTGPAPATSAPNPPAVVWTGTLASTNWSFSPFGVSVQLAVNGNTVTGNWLDLPWQDFGGNIVGTLDGTSFAGTVSINQCKAEFRGTLTDTSANWTSPGVTEPCTIFPSTANPVGITLQFSR